VKYAQDVLKFSKKTRGVNMDLLQQRQQQLKVWQRIAETLSYTLLNECMTTEEVIDYTSRLEKAVEKVNSLL
jgi:hypothetical protein